jgi:hypothetical protein
VLHELTAILPLVGLATAFHYANWLPESVVQGKLVQDGVQKWGRYFRRKGWVDGDDSSSPAAGAVVGASQEREGKGAGDAMKDLMASRGAGWRVVLEVATAWAVVKVLLPVRIVACVWATPWFARVAVLPVMGLARRVAGKPKMP